MTTPSAPNAPQDPNDRIDAIGDEHVGTSIDTPLRSDAFDMSDEDKAKDADFSEKTEAIEEKTTQNAESAEAKNKEQV